jgi:hypothetical protein
MRMHENDQELTAEPARSDGKGAAREMLQAWLEGPVVTIELTPEQQQLLAQQTNGKIDASSLKLRPNLDLRTFLSEVTDIEMSDMATACAPPPKGSYWVVTGTS